MIVQVKSVILIVSVIWRKPVLAYAVSVIIDGLGEFGEFDKTEDCQKCYVLYRYVYVYIEKHT